MHPSVGPHAPPAAAARDLSEETGTTGRSPRTGDIAGIPPGIIGYP
jgi:hypothetical protein